MANYEGWRITNGSRQVTQVPNPAILTGDFSAEMYTAPSGSGLRGGLLPAYGTADCNKLLTLSGNCMPIDPATGQPFPGNKIPTAAQTGNVGQVAIKNSFWQTPTIPNQPEGTVNFIKSVGFPLHQNQQTYRGDQNLGKFGSVFFRYTDANYTNQGFYNSQDLVHGYDDETYLQKQTSWTVSHTINLGAKSVNNFRFGHLTANALGRDNDAVETSLKLNKLYPDDPEVLYQTGRIYGNYAYFTMEKLQTVAPNSVWMLQARGEANESQKSYDAAIDAFNHVLSIGPRRPGIHHRMGRIYLGRFIENQNPKDREAAVREFNAELEVNPRSGNARLRIG